jgi:hypothetical protein
MIRAPIHRIAIIKLDSVFKRSFNWITSSNKPFVEYDAVDIDDNLITAVYDLYRHVYGKISKTLYIKNKLVLLKYTRWLILIDQSGKLAGFMLCREHPCGVKLGLTGATDTKAAKKAVVELNRKALNVQGVFAEVSPPLESVLKGYVNPVKASVAAKVLGLSKKTIQIHKDGYHYSRVISKIGKHKKQMVGKPDVS